MTMDLALIVLNNERQFAGNIYTFSERASEG